MRMWLIIRILVIAWCAACGAVSGDHFAPDRWAVGWPDYAFMFICCTLGVPLMVGFQLVARVSDRRWTKPSWTGNPFNLKQPLHAFHLMSMAMLGIGAGVLLGTSLHGFHAWRNCLVPVALGSGLWVGVLLCTIVFRWKFSETKHSDPTESESNAANTISTASSRNSTRGRSARPTRRSRTTPTQTP